MKITHASALSNDQLAAELSRLARGEREATVALIVHLAEFDARRLYRGAGFRCLFDYCMGVLRLSEDAVFNRIETARAARRYPVIVDMLEQGSLSLTTARMLARKLTPENHEELLAAAAGKSKQDVEKLLARLFPEAEVPPSIRKLPTAEAARIDFATAGARPLPVPISPAAAGEPRPPDLPPPPTPRPLVRPLAKDRYEVRFTASEETRGKLQLAQEMLSHVIPSGDLAQVFDRALRLLVEDLARKKFSATRRPANDRGQADVSRNVPADVKRKVWVRDRGCCAFVSSDGHRCAARRFVEFHHVVPYGAGGRPTVDNIALRCRAHNGYEAELFYGPVREYGGRGVPRETAPAHARTANAESFRNGPPYGFATT